jgi:acyl-CoA synthetase (AMP-forming)/AMP-acid ligase II
MLTHSNVFANVSNFNYWMRYKEGGAYLHVAPIFLIADLPAMFAAPAFGACQAAMPRFNASSFCEAVAKERISYTVLVPTMINLLLQFVENNPCDLSSLEVLAYGGSPMAPELIRRTRRFLPNAKLVQVYGLSETGFLRACRTMNTQMITSRLAGDLAPVSKFRLRTSQATQQRLVREASWWRAVRT